MNAACVYVASYDFKAKYWTDETYGHNTVLLLTGWDYPNFKGLNQEYCLSFPNSHQLLLKVERKATILWCGSLQNSSPTISPNTLQYQKGRVTHPTLFYSAVSLACKYCFSSLVLQVNCKQLKWRIKIRFLLSIIRGEIN